MNREAEETLRLFQCDYNRSIEENFAQAFSEKDDVRLFFINENQAFTDGQNIVVDPALGEMFADTDALIKTEDHMGLDRYFSADRWYALRMITRGLNIHECLHIIYTDFPCPFQTDTRAATKARKKTLARISNIIEDAFIEAVGCSVYDNLELYLRFNRLASLYSAVPTEGTARTFGEETDNAQGFPPIVEYLEYMMVFLLYPMASQSAPSDDIKEYVDKTKQLFSDGSVCGNSETRYTFTQKIFDIIEPLIPENEDDLDDDLLNRLLPGDKTHADGELTIRKYKSEGKTVEVTRRLFADLDGNELDENDFAGQTGVLIGRYADEKDAALRIVQAAPRIVEWNGTQFDCSVIHKNITLTETKPKPNLNLRTAYQNIYNKYRININSYNSRFTQLLKARVPVREEKKLFGSGITSKNLADVKKRYWYRNAEDLGVPDIAILLLIDGSCSMEGERREGAMTSSVILHEVLKKQGITHAIVEHRAIYYKPEVEHNILIDFNAKDEEKFNILTLKAAEGTREGLSLFWAEKYLNQNTVEQKKLLLVLSDGVPAHTCDDDDYYYPPVSTKDTANAASKIIRRGTDIIAIALDNDEDESCYDDLVSIYPSVIACTDLKRLTGQLLGIISKSL